MLFMMSKIQILKAIHNYMPVATLQSIAVYDVKDTNFESNSQLDQEQQLSLPSCL